MIKCNVDPNNLKEQNKKIKGYLATIRNNPDFIQQARNYFDGLFKEWKDQYDIKDTQTLIEGIFPSITRFRLQNIDSEFFNPESLKHRLIDTYNGVSFTEEQNNSSERVEKQLTEDDSETGLERLSNLYNLAPMVYIRAKQDFNNYLVNHFLINRETGIRIKDYNDLNRSIKQLKQQLVNNIYEYLKDKNYNKSLFDLYTNGVYNKNFEKIRQAVSDSVKMDANQLLNTYNRAYSGNMTAQTKLKAFNSWALLNNFDAYVASIFGKNILIKNSGSFDTEYAFSDRNKEANTTWRSKENYDPEKEVSGLIKLIVNTTPIYSKKNDAKTGQYLLFNQFQNSIKQLKDLSHNYYDFKNLPPALKQTLSPYARAVINEYGTLAALVQSIRLAPKNISVLYELFADSDFFNNGAMSSVIKQWSLLDIDIMYSIHKGLLNITSKNTNSIGQIDVDYYNDLLHLADSTSSNNLLQYYTSEDGVTTVRLMKDLGLSNIKQQIEFAINTTNAKSLHRFPIFQKRYNIVGNETQNSISATIEIPNTGIVIQTNTKKTPEIYLHGKQVTKVQSSPELINFINEILGQNLNNTEFRKNLTSLYSDEETMLANLAMFADDVLLNSYVEETKLPNNDSVSAVQKVIQDYYNNSGMKIDYKLGSLSSVNSSHNSTTLNNLEKAWSRTYGLNAASTIKDSEGNSQSTVAQSRLFDNIETQFLLIKRNENNVMHDSFLLKNADMYKGAYIVKEYTNRQGESKSYLSFTPAEQIQTQYVYDYLYGLNDDESNNSLLGNGRIAINSSENSDKPNSPRIILDLNKKLTGTNIALKDASYSQLLEFARTEILGIYERQHNQVLNDWRMLFGDKIGTMNPWDYLNSQENPELFLENAIKAYNNKNFNHPISIIDQTHYVKIKSSDGKRTLFRRNPAVESIIHRYSSPELTANFFKRQESLIAKTLGEQGFKLNVTSDPKLSRLQDLKSWIDENGFAINSKYDSQGNFVALHPEMAKYNLINFVFSEEFLIAGVGTFTNHPSKYKEIYESDWKLKNAAQLAGLSTAEIETRWEAAKWKHMEEDEAARKKAQNKRNVSWTAAMLEFTRNIENGAPNNYKVAVITDIKNKQYNMFGDISGTKPYDGATFVNPLMVYLENNSLCSDKAGVIKKPFIHYYNEALGTAGIIKTASFGITNDHMRTSIFEQQLNRKMNDIVWRDQNDNKYVTDLTKIDINDLPEEVYFFRDGRYYKFLGFSKSYTVQNADNTISTYTADGDNQYFYQIQEVSESGQPLSKPTFEPNPITINTNWKLYNILGGYNSMTLKNGVLKFSESSITNLVYYINNIKEKRVNPLADDLAVYQPLKESMIHYCITEGAIKQGAANINKIEDINSETVDDSEPMHSSLSYFQFRMTQGGIQLDKEHESSEAELSLMTQVWNACALRGFTFDQAKDIYENLTKFADNATNNVVEALLNSINNDDSNKDAIRAQVNKLVLETLSEESRESFATRLAKKTLDKVKRGDIVNYSDNLIPFSDNAVYNKLVSVITVALTKSGIKAKIPGTLAIISPAYGNMKLYGNKKLSQYKPGELAELQKEYDNHPIINFGNNNYQDIEIGREYKLIYEGQDNVQNFYVQTPLDRQNLIGIIQKGLNGETAKCKLVENIEKGRDLATYNVKFTTNYGNNYSLFDLDSVNLLFRLKNENLDINQLQSLVNQYLNPEYQQKVISAFTTTNVQQSLIKEVEKIVHYESCVLSKALKLPDNQVYINKQAHTVNKNSIQIRQYELMMSKKWVKEFGLDEDTQPSDINSPLWFFQRAFNKWDSANINFDIALKNLNGEHIYLLDSSKLGQLSSDYERVAINTKHDTKGNLWRVDFNGKKLYRLASEDDQVYSKDGIEIIVTNLENNIQSYLKQLKYNDIDFSSLETEDEIENILKKLDSENYIQNNVLRRFKFSDTKRTIGYKAINQALYDNQPRTPETIEDVLSLVETNPRYYQMWKNAQKMYASFQKSLEVIASRTPAQSMQSAMVMKVVGFDNPDSNVAYVCDAQLWLQGSDLDIDTVNLATYFIDKNGILPTWSPYTDYLQLNKSMELLPEPTGEETKLRKQHDSDTPDLYISDFKKIFGDDGILTLNDKGKFVNNPAASIETIADILNRYNNKTLYIFEPDDSTKAILAEELKISNDQVGELLNQFKKFVDKHNLYYNNSYINLAGILANKQLFGIHSVLGCPANQIQAQKSVDAVTKLVTTITENVPENETAKTELAENFLVKILDFYRSQVGKKGVGISAASLKTFEGLTYAYNYLLRYGDANQQKNLLFNNRFNGISYHVLANAYTNKLDDIKNLELKHYVENLDQDRDAALEISAFLGLAVDNAKELQLYKLNADENTLGMYLYGSMVGIPVATTASYIMSATGRLYTSLANGNIFDTKAIKLPNLSAVHNYIHNGFDIHQLFGKNVQGDSSPETILLSFLQTIDSSIASARQIFKRITQNKFNYQQISSIFSHLENDPVTKELYEELLKWYNLNQIVRQANDNNELLNKTLYEVDKIIQSNEIDPDQKAQSIINTCISNLHTRNQFVPLVTRIENISETTKSDLYNLRSHIEKLCSLYYDKNGDEELYKLIKGSQELRSLGSILSLNQGLPTKSSDLINLVTSIEDIISDSKNDNEINSFAPSYDHQQLANLYAEKKVTFNIPLIVTNIPHFNFYLQLLIAAHNSLQTVSARYRESYQYAKEISEEKLPKKDKIQQMKNYDNYIMSQIIDDYLFGKTISIPSTETYYDSYGNEQTNETNQPLTIQLGTLYGNATFKKWMETYVIPRLKEGLVSYDNTKSINVSTNEFIRQLSSSIYSLNTSKNPSINYSLNINMMPRTDNERLIFNFNKHEFNKLRTINYTMADDTKIPLTDLFFLYNLIAYHNKQGQNSLATIFEDYTDQGLYGQYNQNTAVFDKDKHIDTNDSLAKAYYTAKRGSDYSKENYVYITPYDRFKSLLAKHNEEQFNNQDQGDIDEEEMGYIDEEEWGRRDPTKLKNYHFVGNPALNTNYFTEGRSAKESDPIFTKDYFIIKDDPIDYLTFVTNNAHKIIVKTANGDYVFKKNADSILEVQTKQGMQKIEQIKIPKIQTPTGNIVDKETLVSFLDNIINPC